MVVAIFQTPVLAPACGVKVMRRFSLLVFFLLLAVAISYSESGKPKMVIDELVFDAGVVIRTGPPIEHVFRVKNTGNADLNILEVKPG